MAINCTPERVSSRVITCNAMTWKCFGTMAGEPALLLDPVCINFELSAQLKLNRRIGRWIVHGDGAVCGQGVKNISAQV